MRAIRLSPGPLVPRHPWTAGAVCLLIVVFFHSPRWWLLRQEAPGSFEWSRGRVYFQQCEAPLRGDVEPAMRWRLLPQALVWAMGGSRVVAVVLPWVGAWALLAFLFGFAVRRGCERPTAFFIVLLLGATAPVLATNGWLGVNDAWVALGLCQLAFGHSRVLLVLACIACPLVDERFVIGVPGALALRGWPGVEIPDGWKFAAATLVRTILALLPFAAIRLVGARWIGTPDGGLAFWLESARASGAYLWVAPVALWFALRVALVPMAWLAASVSRGERGQLAFVFAAAAGPVLVGFLFASDTFRTAGLLLPPAAWCAVELAKRAASVPWGWLALGSLLVPAAHVSHVKIMPINSLPVEIHRLIR